MIVKRRTDTEVKARKKSDASSSVDIIGQADGDDEDDSFEINLADDHKTTIDSLVKHANEHGYDFNSDLGFDDLYEEFLADKMDDGGEDVLMHFRKSKNACLSVSLVPGVTH
jgi:hypothetical protein